MNISLNHRELAGIVSKLAKRKILIDSSEDSSINFHTKESVMFFSLDIDWYFKYKGLENDVIYLDVKTSGWASSKGLRDNVGTINGIEINDNKMSIKLKSLIPYKYRFLKVESISLKTDGIGISFTIES